MSSIGACEQSLNMTINVENLYEISVQLLGAEIDGFTQKLEITLANIRRWMLTPIIIKWWFRCVLLVSANIPFR